MRADPYDVKTVFGFERQLFAPLFQRPYVWEEDKQWNPFWEDIRRVAEELLAGREGCKPHFLGAVVLDQMRVPVGKPDARSIIDGQQRLTTLQLLMEAVRDLCRGRPELDRLQRRMEKLIENQDVSHPDDRFKVWPTNVDRPVYRAIMETVDPETLRLRIKEVCGGKRSKLADAYEYFHQVIGDWLALDADGGTARCEALVNAIRDKLRIVVIDMDEQDDAQVIFETLNARGTPLLPSDLVKNYLFQQAQDARLDVEKLYAANWEEFDTQDHYWREEIGVGRTTRARIDVYLQHFLAFHKRHDIPLPELFTEFRNFATGTADRGVKWHLETFHRFAQHFKRFDQTPPTSPEAKFFDRLSLMQVTTVYPFLLGLYEHVPSEEQRLPILNDLESFLVRRMVCRLTTQGYNRLFLDLVAKLGEGGGYSHAAVRQFLLDQTADSSRWPDDAEFREAWLNQPLYSAITRPRLRIVLTALDSALHTKLTESYTLKKGLTVEHLLPQHWEKHWPLPEQEGETPQELEERVRRRNTLLHSIGNLTLLTDSLNPLVSNGPFKQKKREILKHSAINLNRFLQEESDWDEGRILERGEQLFKIVLPVWAYPKVELTAAEDAG